MDTCWGPQSEGGHRSCGNGWVLGQEGRAFPTGWVGGSQRDVVRGPDTVFTVLSHRMRKGLLTISIHSLLVKEAVWCQ